MSYVKTMIKEVRFFLFTLGKSEISLGTFTSLALFDPLNDALHSPTFPPPNLSQWPLFASKKYAAVRNPSPLLENVLTICLQSVPVTSVSSLHMIAVRTHLAHHLLFFLQVARLALSSRSSAQTSRSQSLTSTRPGSMLGIAPTTPYPSMNQALTTSSNKPVVATSFSPRTSIRPFKRRTSFSSASTLLRRNLALVLVMLPISSTRSLSFLLYVITGVVSPTFFSFSAPGKCCVSVA